MPIPGIRKFRGEAEDLAKKILDIHHHVHEGANIMRQPMYVQEAIGKHKEKSMFKQDDHVWAYLQ